MALSGFGTQACACRERPACPLSGPRVRRWPGTGAARSVNLRRVALRTHGSQPLWRRKGRPACHGEPDPLHRTAPQASVNAEKSAVAQPWRRSFLGFTVRNDRTFRRCIADKAIARFKHRVRALTGRHRGITLERMIRELVPYLRGWAGYFGFSQWRELASLDGWIRRRLRCVVWVQWKTRGRRYRELRRLKVSERLASAAIFSPKGPSAAERRGSSAPRLHQSSLRPSGPPLHGKAGRRLIRRTAVVRTRMPGGVGGAAS